MSISNQITELNESEISASSVLHKVQSNLQFSKVRVTNHGNYLKFGTKNGKVEISKKFNGLILTNHDGTTQDLALDTHLDVSGVVAHISKAATSK